VRRDALQPWPTVPPHPSSMLHLHSSRITLARRGEVSKDLEPVYICANRGQLGIRKVMEDDKLVTCLSPTGYVGKRKKSPGRLLPSRRVARQRELSYRYLPE